MVSRLVRYYLQIGEFAVLSIADMPGGIQPGFTSVAPGEVSKAKVYTPSIDHLSALVEVVAELVVACEHPMHPKGKKDGGESRLRLPSPDRTILIEKNFFPGVIGDAVGIEHVRKIALHWIQGSKEFSKFFIVVLRDGILSAAKKPEPYMVLLSDIQDMEDGLQYWRVDCSLFECLRIIRR